MKHLYVLFFFLLFAACSSTNSRTDTMREGKVIKLDEGDSGKTVELNSGDVVEITLKANASTGYKWELENPDSTVIRKIQENYTRKAEGEKLVGGGGFFVVKFQAAAPGTAELKMVYRRPFEKDAAPAAVFKVNFVVK